MEVELGIDFNRHAFLFL